MCIFILITVPYNVKEKYCSSVKIFLHVMSIRSYDLSVALYLMASGFVNVILCCKVMVHVYILILKRPAVYHVCV